MKRRCIDLKYPKMNRQARRTVSIPSLSGGMNLRDSLNMCNDNQLTDSVNMWFRDGVLKTRDGINTAFKHAFLNGISCNGDVYTADTKVHKDIRMTQDGQSYTLVSAVIVYEDYYDEEFEDTYDLAVIYTIWVGKSWYYPEYAGAVRVRNTEDFNYFILCHKNTLYCFVKSDSNYIYKSEDRGSYWEEVPKEDIYAPLIMTNCLTHSILDTEDALLAGGAVMYEGYNLLGNRYRMKYSTVNTEKAPHAMTYSLLFNTADFNGSKVIAKHTTKDGTFTHEVEISTDTVNLESTSPGDNLLMRVVGKMLSFVDAETKEAVFVSEDNYIENNLEITAPCSNDITNINRVFNMTRCEWFGGASAGTNGGTRLFLGGNTAEEEKSLILWSGLNNPLYFPENCYSYVGNSMSAVTAFGKQSDMLVIFKENELYYTRYAQSTEVAAEGLISGSVIDYAARGVYFPLVQIHTGIGCDCPDTVQLCRNRLVWADSSGGVYTLTSSGQYSGRNIFSVGDMIERRLKSELGLKNACSANCDGYYMLFAGNSVYLMDYNSYGYQYISSYSKAEDANLRIPWYYWELDSADGMQLSVEGRLYFITLKAGEGIEGNEICLSVKHLDSDTDDGEPIPCFAQTKFFDFGTPNYRKNIENVGLTLGNNGGNPITVKYVTESGEDYSNITLTDSETEIRNAGYIQSKILNPCIRQAVRFGIQLSCNGSMAVEGLNITYRILGGER